MQPKAFIFEKHTKNILHHSNTQTEKTIEKDNSKVIEDKLMNLRRKYRKNDEGSVESTKNRSYSKDVASKKMEELKKKYATPKNSTFKRSGNSLDCQIKKKVIILNKQLFYFL